jgi:hypothetical protein
MLKNNEEAFQMLMSPKSRIIDKFIQEIKFFYENYVPCIKLSFSQHNGEGITYELEFKALIQYDLYFEEYGPGYLEDYKLIILDNGLYYFSLDPDNAVAERSENDCGIIISKAITLNILGSA